ncbi:MULTISPECIES: tyrosine-type recombinase/integrase [Cellulophaga]|uniref:Tyrosine recombinase XerC n=1 Tax=Cellulophaga baltica 18 TaxID=1348584 RepID=A0AAU8RLY9_9FLAO|nr:MULTISPECIES: tyrosine-type recombinase/integrase [Cellulophaga]AIZ41733.1 integrase [Cellulophaga baltica 18]KGK29489.1 integrase [Cellulophaga sp. E6(2014)]MCR1026628.1 tyrosine-type recombinase/integrase [Cellulophaga baltica]WFO17847.1 tyrosine-type recombinase/integrase [Cellulophaga baltica 4]
MSEAAFIAYLALEKKYSLNTLKAYENDLAEFSLFCKAECPKEVIDHVSYAIIRNWIVALVDAKIANRTINRKISSLKAYYKFLLKTETIAVNPLAKHKALKTAKKIEIPFSEAEMQQVLNALSFSDDFEGLRDKLIIELLYATGIRRIELVMMRLSNVDLQQKTIKVLGKRNKERIIPLIDSLVVLFQEYFNSRKAVVINESDDFVFLLKSGSKIYETLVYRIINHYFSLVSSKVKKSPHILRHTFATHLLNKGADLNSVKELLGHASLASTQVYTHNSIAELKKVHLRSHPRNKN